MKNTRIHSQKGSAVDIMMLSVTVLAMLIFIMGGCGSRKGDDEAVARATKAYGLTNVTITDRSYTFLAFRGCDGHDRVAYDIQGTDRTGGQFSGYVCLGAFNKGATVRTK